MILTLSFVFVKNIIRFISFSLVLCINFISFISPRSDMRKCCRHPHLDCSKEDSLSTSSYNVDFRARNWQICSPQGPSISQCTIVTISLRTLWCWTHKDNNLGLHCKPNYFQQRENGIAQKIWWLPSQHTYVGLTLA